MASFATESVSVEDSDIVDGYLQMFELPAWKHFTEYIINPPAIAAGRDLRTCNTLEALWTRKGMLTVLDILEGFEPGVRSMAQGKVVAE